MPSEDSGARDERRRIATDEQPRDADDPADERAPAELGAAAGRWSGRARIVLAATPIGNAQDATPNLLALLAEADVVAAEDTRRLRTLLARLGIRTAGRVVSYHEHNESERAAELVELAREGATVAVVSDAGMPSVSDPGFRVVRAAAEAGVRVSALPGPSAVLTALAVSGLASDRFCFEGFAPRRAGERRRALEALAAEPRTLVFFESPHRLAATLEAMATAFGHDRAAAVCRELTKTYEEVRRGPLGELAAWASEGVRGEITVVVAGAPPVSAEPGDHVAEVLARVAAGERLKDVSGDVAARVGVSRRELYDAALAAREG
ncbi:Uroporphyrin-III C/tetrapyrrole (Corrin/Porphyrin) methyltransferase [Beutenbergia cavernae DSM 12333]|uniref:Ribosomal RNA small subunit methyltransferase I n=1 Tax=Beutenbergia cavernae (strain ATCC BAA-8 / DSM 12333 / CCUG 43141 / JCM 11478 / NBRC 16432 / NCIMB 13614 / HKI 0122) TaxID=471853 RepID=C5C026_BEUC1|nr:16S rRNA (cytidine(1402)-2'-O)-methyltransferase [Beutenbergia cavernae]ACQ79212.1 Uroporphyrin-III C/tetrapyrrole (Corrin/Porphyrin) methyltransferase [Beutenbergia cavernae DSM 12333]